MTYGTALKLGIGGCALIVFVIVWKAFFGGHAFDPDELASAETRMWQAYYGGDKQEIGLEIVRVLRTQFGMSFLDAGETGILLGRASMRFRSMRGSSAEGLLPDLTEVYRRIKKSSAPRLTRGKRRKPSWHGGSPDAHPDRIPRNKSA